MPGVRLDASNAVATEHLANTGAASLAVLGSGVQAEAHVHALAKVLPLTAVRIWSRAAGDASRVGIGVQDAAAWAVVGAAREHGLERTVSL